MADIKISELTQVSALNNGDLVEVSQVNALAPSGYTSLKASMTDLGKKVNSDIEYTTDLADFTDKTTLGAIKETAKDKNVADEYDDTQTYDKGDVVIYKNTLYICTTNNTTGTWDASKWTATTVQSLIGDLSQLTTSVTSSLVGAVNELNKPTALTLSNVPTGVTSNSKAYKLSGGLILIMVEVTFSSASTSWQNAFDIAWSGTAITNSFGVVTNEQNDNTYAQAYWNTDKITVRVSSPKATLYRGQIIVPAV